MRRSWGMGVGGRLEALEGGAGRPATASGWVEGRGVCRPSWGWDLRTRPGDKGDRWVPGLDAGGWWHRLPSWGHRKGCVWERGDRPLGRAAVRGWGPLTDSVQEPLRVGLEAQLWGRREGVSGVRRGGQQSPGARTPKREGKASDGGGETRGALATAPGPHCPPPTPHPSQGSNILPVPTQRPCPRAPRV